MNFENRMDFVRKKEKEKEKEKEKRKRKKNKKYIEIRKQKTYTAKTPLLCSPVFCVLRCFFVFSVPDES